MNREAPVKVMKRYQQASGNIRPATGPPAVFSINLNKLLFLEGCCIAGETNAALFLSGQRKAHDHEKDLLGFSCIAAFRFFCDG